MNIARLIGGLVLLLSLVGVAAHAQNPAEAININTADAQTIASGLTGVGEVRVRAIVDYREQNGRFESIDDLIHVNGIGEKTLAAIRDSLTLGEPAQDTKPAE